MQYASLVLAHDEVQLAIARDHVERLSASLGAPLATRVERLKRFHVAEDYHQKYHLRNDRALMADFRAVFDDDESAFRESAAAARVNGYVAGYGTRSQLGAELEFLGLTDAGRSRLISAVGGAGDGIGCSVG